MKDKILDMLLKEQGFVSGQKICETFGVSRTAVWKAVHQLTEEGYQIEAVRNKGYRLIQMPDYLSKKDFLNQLHTDWAGRNIYILDEVDSTNDEAKRLAESGEGHGTVIISKKQTAGKGRRGRSFESPMGCGLFMSMIIRDDIQPSRASMLTLVMGIAVTKALETLNGLNVQIKWPNDVLAGGKKICGILTEMSMQIECMNYLVIGCGVNIRNESFPEEIKDRATSVLLEGGNLVSYSELAVGILEQFEVYYQLFMRNQDLTEIVDEYNEYLINKNRQVTVLNPKGQYEGLALGINTRGELMVQTRQEVKYVTAGEVSVRGIYGYI